MGVAMNEKKDNGVVRKIEVDKLMLSSVYYVSCANAFADVDKTSPYEKAYQDAQDLHPFVQSDNVAAEVEAEEQDKVVQPQADSKMLCKENRYFTKRPFIMLLILVLGLVAFAIPIVSALSLVPEYIDIGTNIFSITELFQGELALEIITDNIPLWITALYMVFALMLIAHSLIALLGKKKKRFGIITGLVLVIALAFVFSVFAFDFARVISEITTLSWGVYGLMAAPALALILSLLAYKELKN